MDACPCLVRKCAYAAVWVLDCRACDETGEPRVLLESVGFCFWHYLALTTGRLRVKDVWATPTRHANLTLEAIR